MRRLCSVRKATTKEEILEFIKIYYENMDRVDARSSYYFESDLREVADKYGLKIAGILQRPIDNLIAYHQKK